MNLRWRGMGLLLALLLAVPGAAASPPARGDDEPLPPGARARLGSLWLRETCLLTFLPGGKTAILWGGFDGAGVWDIATGRLIRRIGPRDGYMIASRDGRFVASGSPHLTIWETATGQKKEVRRFVNRPNYFDVSSQGTAVVAQHGGGFVYLLDVKTGKEIGRIAVPAQGFLWPSLSANGEWLAAFADANEIHVWNVATQAEQGLIAESNCRSFAFANDDKCIVTASADGKLRVRAAPGGKLMRILAEQKPEVRTVIASPDGSRVAAGLEDGVHVWDAATWKELRRWQRPAMVPAAFSADNRVLAAYDAGACHLRFWDMATGQELHPTRGHHGSIAALTFSPDGTTLWSISSDKTARAWDWQAGREVKCLPLGTGRVIIACVTPDRKTAAVAQAERAGFRALDLATGKVARSTITAPTPFDGPTALSPDGRFLAWHGWDRKVRAWDIGTDKECHVWPTAQRTFGLAFSADGKTVVFGERLQDNVLSALHVRDMGNGKELHRIELPGNIACIAAAPDGRAWATTEFGFGQGGPLRFWNDRWEALFSAGWQQGYCTPVFSPDSRLVALPNLHETAFRVLEVATGAEVRRFDAKFGDTRCAAFAPDGRTLATGQANSTVLVWDLTGRGQDAALADRWTDLAGADAARAYDAVWALVAAPRQSMPLLRARLRPVAPPDSQRVARLIEALDSDDFDTRDQARNALERLGELAEPALRQALAGPASLEMRRRIGALLDVQKRLPMAGDAIRNVRAVQALEYLGTPEARQLLHALAGGMPGARLTREAQRALRRLQPAQADGE